MKKMFTFLSCIGLFLGYTPVQAEIQIMLIQWQQGICQEMCVNTLERNLRGVPGVTNVTMNAPAAVAELQWNPQAPFTFDKINQAVRLLGLRIDTIRLRVQGMISHDASHYYLTSLGDNTRFQIVGPLASDPSRHIIKSNIASYPLTDTLKQQLTTAEAHTQPLIIEGPLFQPDRQSYGLVLIAEQIFVPTLSH